jgi:nucleoside-diphosphate-sugar epimerase
MEDDVREIIEMIGEDAQQFAGETILISGGFGPRACYDESKRLGETIATVYQQRYNVPVSIVRPFNVFGPGMKHNDRRVIPMFTYQALNGRPLPVGSQTCTFCYISGAICGSIKTLLKGLLGFLRLISRYLSCRRAATSLP